MTQQDKQQQKHLKRSNTKIVVIGVSVVIAMFLFGFAMVPLYNVLCNITGLNGKTQGATSLSTHVDKNRWVTVQFVATKNENLPWKFYPLVKKVRVHPGENKRIAYYAENDSSTTMTVQAIPSVAPADAARYLKKTECFCFNQQTLKSHEGIDMPMIFHIDQDIPKHIKEISLSYTLFNAKGIRPVSSSKAGRLK